MTPDFSPEQQKELLDDFYSECDEQFGAIRAALADLESHADSTPGRAAALETIFRNLHSLKGNSAIAGLRAAEALAHQAEDYLRQLTRGQRALSDDGLDTLIHAAQRLEQIVASHRSGQALPDAADLHARLSSLTGRAPGTAEPAPSPSAERAAPTTPAAPALPAQTWRCTFVPAAELDKRGVHVASVRARLSAAGKILRAEPHVNPAGGISFEFLVSFSSPPPDPASWESDGLRLEPVQEAAEPPPAAPLNEPGPAAAEPAASFVAPSHVVRVDLGRLDDLMRIAGELVIHRSRLEERIAQTPGDTTGLRDVNLSLLRSLRQLREAITRVRLVPVAEIFSRMPYVIRDLTRESGKRCRLVVEGQQTAIDKYLVERLKEPLLHLVRNAFSHGVETPDERRAAGKNEEAEILLRASPAGGFVQIEVQDDGRGIDPERVVRKAREAGLATPEVLDPDSLLDLLCTPGFSTRDQADRAAGRGVGMAVVAAAVRELGGTLSLESTAGQGTRFLLRLPLTLSILETLIVSVGTQICAVPQAAVDQIIEVDDDSTQWIRDNEVIPYRDGVLPLVRLRKHFRLEASPRSRHPVLVVQSERGSVGLLVDSVVTQREVVVRPLKDALVRTPGILGATELGDGRPVLILDPVVLGRGVVRPARADRKPVSV